MKGEIYLGLISEKTVIIHSGAMTQKLVEQYAMTLRGEISDCSAFAVFIEIAQNIMKYSAELSDGCGCGRITVRLMPERCVIESSNPVTEAVRRELDARLAEIIPLSREELRRLFSERIRENNHGSGGGVGLIQIAQAVCEPLRYSFEAVDGNIVFALCATVSL